MPKFDKPKLNQPKVNKSKLDDRPNQSKSFLSEAELPPVQLDETIVAGRRPKPLNDFERLLMEVPELRAAYDPELFGPLPPKPAFNAKQFESKTRNIFGSQNIDVSRENLTKYLDYLKQNIQLPCYVTGIEEFEWEEEYTMGSASQKEYAQLKKTQPSYTDTFALDRLEDLVLEEERIFVEVHRLGDCRTFTLPLADLETFDECSPNTPLLDDYAVWFVNY